MSKQIHVAVGVIQNACGEIFIAQRAADAHQGGLWEFPGGKLEPGETTSQALTRELREELAIDVEACEPLIQIRHQYPDKAVLLDVYRVTAFSGEPRGNEGQPVRWVSPGHLGHYAFPAANRPIIKALGLPSLCAISGAYRDAADLVKKLQHTIQSGAGMFVLRDRQLAANTHLPLIAQVGESLASTSVQFQINTSVVEFEQIQLHYPMAGLHLNRHELRHCRQRPVADEVCLGASCHNPEELEMAERVGVDYVFLSPVLPTLSHPGATPLGWPAFADWVKQINVSVYALGGVTPAQLDQAKLAGAQGIAAIRAFWP